MKAVPARTAAGRDVAAHAGGQGLAGKLGPVFERLFHPLLDDARGGRNRALLGLGIAALIVPRLAGAVTTVTAAEPARTPSEAPAAAGDVHAQIAEQLSRLSRDAVKRGAGTTITLRTGSLALADTRSRPDARTPARAAGTGTGAGASTAAGPDTSAPHQHPVALAARAQHGEAEPVWDWQGERGPEHWHALHPSWARCSSGTRQSPIDIQGGLRVELEAPQIDYRPSAFRVIDDGHTVETRLAPGNTLTVQGRRFELVDFHFHQPGGDRIHGREYDMVVHLVHRDAEGRQAVLAVMLEPGPANETVQAVWNNLPLERFEELTAPGRLDPARLLPADRGYYTFMGSRTMPPCQEGVLWLVMRTPMTISTAQQAIFTRLHARNARPVQPLAGRLIKQSE
jgi:carbonic anhydrase